MGTEIRDSYVYQPKNNILQCFIIVLLQSKTFLFAQNVFQYVHPAEERSNMGNRLHIVMFYIKVNNIASL